MSASDVPTGAKLMHQQIFLAFDNELAKGTHEYIQFETMVAAYLGHGVIARCNTASELVRKLQDCGKFQIGNYEVLKKMLTIAKLISLRGTVEKLEKEIVEMMSQTGESKAHTLKRDEACAAVRQACYSDRVDILPGLFADRPVEDLAEMARSGLRAAGYWRQVRSVDYLLRHHCPTVCTGPDCLCVRGLWAASWWGWTDIVTWIITSHGQNVNTTVDDDNESTSLHQAAECGQVDVVKFLVSNGANINLKRNDDGKTSLDLAVENPRQPGTTDVVKFLRSKGGQHGNQ